ncbi:hypothetical protein O6H91_Y095200 [Diphasiastrum complanatum]|nr:hypothetical protein O6H91_Y222900 [Diphasiastrum complanatum]KAJ7299484.1 hypothetical protein O6H91_Y222900 [Diphasiastrum complanatum]KAJ7300004.1 hypothetical protein O6H91_Y095200 [Diphasiastrum complanatum]
MDASLENWLEWAAAISWSSTATTTGATVLLLCAILTVMFQLQSLKPKNACGKNISVIANGKIQIYENLDWEPARREVFAEFQKLHLNLNHTLFFENDVGVKTKETYIVNSRGVELFTKIWLPETGKPKAIIFLCHGYGDTITFYFEGIARKFVIARYAVLGMDYEGFGLSSGLHCYIHNFDMLVDDVIEYYTSVREQPEFKGLPCFLLGESMGGAVALKAHLKQPSIWDGAVLVAPMCKIAEDMYPPWLLVQILKILVPLFPTWKLVPNRDVAGHAFRDPEKRKQNAYNVIGYMGRPRLKTALELLRVTDEIEASLHKVSLPLLILHGAADRVTDPSVSKALYEQSNSSDKTLQLYEDAWHCILEGESDECIHKVLDDIVFWLETHCTQSLGKS